MANLGNDPGLRDCSVEIKKFITTVLLSPSKKDDTIFAGYHLANNSVVLKLAKSKEELELAQCSLLSFANGVVSNTIQPTYTIDYLKALHHTLIGRMMPLSYDYRYYRYYYYSS
jgi:hypothetical protein